MDAPYTPYNDLPDKLRKEMQLLLHLKDRGRDTHCGRTGYRATVNRKSQGTFDTAEQMHMPQQPAASSSSSSSSSRGDFMVFFCDRRVVS